MSLLGELKRRNVFRVALLYIVSAWVVIQVVETVLPMFDVPDGALRAIVVVLAIGLVPAIVFAWVFELTPEGLRRDGDAQVSGATRQRSATRLNWATLGIAALAIALLIGDRLVPEAAAPARTGASDSTTAPEAEPVANGTSIAVLAFDNMSPDPDNAYFAEGISEEILNVLAAVEGLKVASRTSAFSFAGSQTPIPQIAETLGVEHVLEGSVRRSGNRVRITAQLIDARNDQHLWSDAFDRDLDDIFRVQEEMAQAITDALKLELGIRDVSVEAATDDLAGYQAFLRGRQKFYRRDDMIDEAVADLRQAVALDPTFTDAWAVLSAACHVAPGYPTELPGDEARRCADEALERALEREPAHPLALAVRGNIAVQQGDWVPGLADLETAVTRASQDSTPAMWLALALYTAGYPNEALPVAQAAWQSDPLVAINNGLLGMILLAVGRAEEAEPLARFAAENGWPIAIGMIGTHWAIRGDGDRAKEALMQSLEVRFDDPGMLKEAEGMISAILAARASGGPSDELRAEIATWPPATRFSAYALFGQHNAAVRALEESVEIDEADRFRTWLRAIWQPLSASVREDGAVFSLFERAGLVALWEHRGYPPGCARVEGAQEPRLDCAGFPAGTSG